MEYRISYGRMEDKVFSEKSLASKFVSREAGAWSDFLGVFSEHSDMTNFRSSRGNFTSDQLAKVFERLSDKLDDPQAFNRITERYGGGILPPPPSDTLEGQLILGLFSENRVGDALSVFAWHLDALLGVSKNINNNHPLMAYFTLGERLYVAACAAASLPFGKVNASALSASKRKLKDLKESFEDKIRSAQTRIEEFDERVAEIEADFEEASGEKDRGFEAAEVERVKKYEEWISKHEADIAQRVSKANRRVQAIKRLNAIHFNQRQRAFERLQDLYKTQLQYKAPVQLWERRSEKHKQNADTSFKLFVGLSVVIIFLAAVVPFSAGTYIADSFYQVVCSGPDGTECSREFSAKGPITVSGLLMIFSLSLWVVRLQYRVFLSERHLSLDASEKKAFAETFLAMKEDADVDGANEAIVLASLFRPTQDGIIKDDENTLDLSAAAILAKQFGRS